MPGSRDFTPPSQTLVDFINSKPGLTHKALAEAVAPGFSVKPTRISENLRGERPFRAGLAEAIIAVCEEQGLDARQKQAIIDQIAADAVRREEAAAAEAERKLAESTRQKAGREAERNEDADLELAEQQAQYPAYIKQLRIFLDKIHSERGVSQRQLVRDLNDADIPISPVTFSRHLRGAEDVSIPEEEFQALIRILHDNYDLSDEEKKLIRKEFFVYGPAVELAEQQVQYPQHIKRLRIFLDKIGVSHRKLQKDLREARIPINPSEFSGYIKGDNPIPEEKFNTLIRILHDKYELSDAEQSLIMADFAAHGYEAAEQSEEEPAVPGASSSVTELRNQIIVAYSADSIPFLASSLMASATVDDLLNILRDIHPGFSRVLLEQENDPLLRIYLRGLTDSDQVYIHLVALREMEALGLPELFSSMLRHPYILQTELVPILHTYENRITECKRRGGPIPLAETEDEASMVMAVRTAAEQLGTLYQTAQQVDERAERIHALLTMLHDSPHITRPEIIRELEIGESALSRWTADKENISLSRGNSVDAKLALADEYIAKLEVLRASEEPRAEQAEELYERVKAANDLLTILMTDRRLTVREIAAAVETDEHNLSEGKGISVYKGDTPDAKLALADQCIAGLTALRTKSEYTLRVKGLVQQLKGHPYVPDVDLMKAMRVRPDAFHAWYAAEDAPFPPVDKEVATPADVEEAFTRVGMLRQMTEEAARRDEICRVLLQDRLVEHGKVGEAIDVHRTTVGKWMEGDKPTLPVKGEDASAKLGFVQTNIANLEHLARQQAGEQLKKYTRKRHVSDQHVAGVLEVGNDELNQLMEGRLIVPGALQENIGRLLEFDDEKSRHLGQIMDVANAAILREEEEKVSMRNATVAVGRTAPAVRLQDRLREMTPANYRSNSQLN